MKYCLSGRQDVAYLAKADEIKVEYRDRNALIDVVDVNPEARIILWFNDPKVEYEMTPADWEGINKYKNMCRNGFALGVNLTTSADNCKEYDYQFMFNFSAYDAFTLNQMYALGASDAYIAGELCHCLDYFQNLPINTRVKVNSPGMMAGMEWPGSYVGGWFRPETHANMPIDVCEFAYNSMRQEQALYRIYAEEHSWSGELNYIIENFGNNQVYNRFLPDDFDEHRASCHMKCLKGGHCKYCFHILDMANPDAVAYFIRLAKGLKNNDT